MDRWGWIKLERFRCLRSRVLATRPTGQALAFQAAGQRSTIDLVPFQLLYGERYTVY